MSDQQRLRGGRAGWRISWRVCGCAGRGVGGGVGRAGWGGCGGVCEAHQAVEGAYRVAAALNVPQRAVRPGLQVGADGHAEHFVGSCYRSPGRVEVEVAQGAVVVGGHEQVAVPFGYLGARIDCYPGRGSAASPSRSCSAAQVP